MYQIIGTTYRHKKVVETSDQCKAGDIANGMISDGWNVIRVVRRTDSRTVLLVTQNGRVTVEINELE